MIERQLIMRFNSCKLTTFKKELTLGTHTYQPGLVLIGELQAESTSRVEVKRDGCALINNEPKGTEVIAEIIDRDDQWSAWRFQATHLLILSHITNLGFTRAQIDLLPPEAGLGKVEKIYWSNEFTRRKYGQHVDWFREVGATEDKLVRIKY